MVDERFLATVEVINDIDSLRVSCQGEIGLR